MHIREGQMKAYLDGELPADERRRILGHLSTCHTCQEKAENMGRLSGQVDLRLASLSRLPEPASRPAEAFGRLQSRLSEKEATTMLSRIFNRRYRMAWIAIGLVLILGIGLAFPPVRAIASSFLGLFRVQRFTVVQVNPGELPSQLGASAQFEALLAKDVKLVEKGEMQTAADPAQASELAGMPVRLPAQIKSDPVLKVMPGVEATFNVDMAQVQALLAEIGRSDIQLPENLDGAVVTVDTSSSVTALYGDCDFDPEQARQDSFDPDSQEIPRLPHCTTLVQMLSPTVSAPAGMDITRIGEAFLQVLGMSAEDAAHFAKNIDWTTTFVIPIPRYTATYRDVTVDGVQGTFIQPSGESRADQYLLMWVKDGVVYALTGPGNLRTALSIADSLK